MGKYLFLYLFLFSIKISQCQQYKFDGKLYNWKKIEDLKDQIGLPDPFLKPDGTRVKTLNEWEEQRAYLKAMLEHYQYGKMPSPPKDIAVQEVLTKEILQGSAILKSLVLTIKHNNKQVDLQFVFVRPKRDGVFPLIIKNEMFNESLNPLTQNFCLNDLAIPESVLQNLVKRNYAYCVFNRNDLATDIFKKFKENKKKGIYNLYPDHTFGSIAIWAWGYTLLIDYFEKLDFIDAERIVATGHSRGGKVAFCAGIFDNRIAITAPNSSGMGGTSSHVFDELLIPNTLNAIPQKLSMHKQFFPHWWASNYYEFAGYENKASFDAHFGKALIAPRAFFNTHAYQDYHANPLGAWITFVAAKKVYEWLGNPNGIAMHFRTGKHEQNEIDWHALLDFCDFYFWEKEPADFFNNKYDFFETNPYPSIKLPVIWDVPNSRKGQ